MEIIREYATKNNCYKTGRIIAPKGIMLHSTATPGVMAAQFARSWNTATPSGKEICVHAFVDDKETVQILPWNYRGWHCGGSGNNTLISFEMCEPKNWKTDKVYFKKCYANAVELAVFLCDTFDFKPSKIISHHEGNIKGIASAHVDPDHWWKYFGKTMDDFRADVAKKLNGGSVDVNVEMPVEELSQGSKGEMVKQLQKRLNFLRGRLPLKFAKLDEDGSFGPKTLEAVKEFQKQRKLSVDGIVGKKTSDALKVNYGDVNGDGKENAADALKVLKAAVGKEKLTAEQKKAADINADGKINATDAQAILKKSVE